MRLLHELLVTLCVPFCYRPTAAATSNLPWYQAVQSQHFPHFYVTDLAEDNVTKAIENVNADYVLIDFYAPWCPHCQHFAPEYERLALAVSQWNNKSSGGKPRILCAEIDCVRSPAACQQYSIESYPSLLWAAKEDWLKKVEPETIKLDKHDAEAASAWINSKVSIQIEPPQLSRQEVLKMWWPSKFQGSQLATKLPEQTQANVWDAQLATALLLRQTFDQQVFPASVESGPTKALMDYVTLLASRFPETSKSQGTPCRRSFATLHDHLSTKLKSQDNDADRIMLVRSDDPDDGGEPAIRIDANKLEGDWQLCNTEWADYKRGWAGCQGTFPGKRGFTCGLWTSFHMLMARTTDVSARRDTEVIRTMISNFFGCEECRQHFLKIDFKDDDASDRRSAQLWWWKAHNLVNARVGKLEKQYQDGDPAFPKMTWPSAELCPTCRQKATNFIRGKKQEIMDVQTSLPDSWNKEATVSFLNRFYGP